MAPAIIKPIKCGILNLFKSIGAKSMMKRIKENNNTGFFNGKANSKKLSKIIIENLMNNNSGSWLKIKILKD
jgi:hypothetical protein